MGLMKTQITKLTEDEQRVLDAIKRAGNRAKRTRFAEQLLVRVDRAGQVTIWTTSPEVDQRNKPL